MLDKILNAVLDSKVLDVALAIVIALCLTALALAYFDVLTK